MIYTAVKRIIQDLLTLGKVFVKSGRPSGAPKAQSHVSGSIIIMGNGPSLRKVMEQDREALMSRPRMAVNFAANAPEYFELRPEYYILADPHFFKSEVREHRSEVREQRAEGRGTRRSRWPQCAASAWLCVQCEELKEEREDPKPPLSNNWRGKDVIKILLNSKTPQLKNSSTQYSKEYGRKKNSKDRASAPEGA